MVYWDILRLINSLLRYTGMQSSLLGYTVHMYLVFIVDLKDGSVVGEVIHQLFSLFQKIIS